MKKPVVLMIMDGFGLNPDAYGNAIKAAKTPNLTRLFAENPFTKIGASGMDVGLPDGQMGKDVYKRQLLNSRTLRRLHGAAVSPPIFSNGQASTLPRS